MALNDSMVEVGERTENVKTNNVAIVEESSIKSVEVSNGQPRKSISQIDEKLIIDALKSTTIKSKSNEKNASKSPTSEFKNNHHHHHNNHHQQPKRSYDSNRAVKFQNDHGHHNNNNRLNHHQNFNQQKPTTFNNANKSKQHEEQQHRTPITAMNQMNKILPTKPANPVIIYYNDPQAKEINVKELLLNKQQTSNLENGNNNNNNKQTIENDLSSNSSTSSSSKYQSSKKFTNNYNSNRTGTSHHKKPHHQNHYHHHHNNHHHQNNHYKANGNGNFHENGKFGDSNQDNWRDKSETVTIYYGDPNNVQIKPTIESLKKSKSKHWESKSSDEKKQNECSRKSIEKIDWTEPCSDDSEHRSKPINTKIDSEQEIKVDSDQNENREVKVESILKNNESSQIIDWAKINEKNQTRSPNEEDVISGGVSIKTAELPTDGTKHPIMCTQVSHPGHFYVRFVNESYEQKLANMESFYQNEEHIELDVHSFDGSLSSSPLLKEGQYFAACRQKSNGQKEWIRVQLLQVASENLINCLLIDEGGLGTFELGQLQPLYNRFRSVPKQAIRVSLSGVEPGKNQMDWQPNQALEFKKLIENQKFHTGQQRFDQINYEEKTPIQIEMFFAKGDLKDRSVAEILVERDLAIVKSN